MANARAIIFLLLSSLGALAQPFTQCELGWDYRRAITDSNSLTDGLLAYYRFEGNGLSSFGLHHLQTNGVMLYDTGKITNGVNYDQFPEYTNYFYLNNTSDVQLITNRTFATWIKLLDSAGDKLVWSKWDASLGSGNQDYFCSVNNVLASLVVYHPAGATGVSYPNPLIVGVWSLLIVWVDTVNSNIVMQMDNDVMVTNTYTDELVFTTNRFRVGNDGTSLFQENHVLDEMSIWNRLLSPLERSNLWNNGNGKTYPFSN